MEWFLDLQSKLENAAVISLPDFLKYSLAIVIKAKKTQKSITSSPKRFLEWCEDGSVVIKHLLADSTFRSPGHCSCLTFSQGKKSCILCEISCKGISRYYHIKTKEVKLSDKQGFSVS